MKNKIVYVDMDNTIVDFKSGIKKLSKEDQEKFKDNFGLIGVNSSKTSKRSEFSV